MHTDVCACKDTSSSERQRQRDKGTDKIHDAMRHIPLHLERDVHNRVAFKYGRDVRVRAYVEATVVAVFVFVLSQNDNLRISVGPLAFQAVVLTTTKQNRLFGVSFLPRLSTKRICFPFWQKRTTVLL